MLRPFTNPALEAAYQAERQEHLSTLDSEPGLLWRSRLAGGELGGTNLGAQGSALPTAQQVGRAWAPAGPHATFPPPSHLPVHSPLSLAAVRAAVAFVGLWLYDLLR